MKEKQSDISKDMERAIKSEKTKESIAILMTLGLLGLSLLFAFTIHWIVGPIVLLIGIYGIWKYYTN
jgi:1,4-dihydroxy-2-naphthoate octaprenyltransferase